MPDLRRIARIAMARCTREAKFVEVQRHYINSCKCKQASSSTLKKTEKFK